MRLPEEILNAVLEQSNATFVIEKEQDEFNLEQSTNRFKETLKTKQIVGRKQVDKSDPTQEVYIDSSSGKIMVGMKKVEKMTGVKRSLERDDDDGEDEKKVN